MKTIIGYVNNLSEWVGKCISWLCLAMILGLVYEVGSRYLLNKPTEWGHEATTMLYGTFCMIGAVWTLKDKEHVRTEVVHQLLPLKLRLLLDILCGMIALLMFAVFFYAAFDFALSSWRSQEISAKSTWGVPIYPFKTVIPVAVALMFLQQLANTLQDCFNFSSKTK